MIVGIGQDMVRTERIGQALARFGDRFKRRIFTADEQALAESRQHSVDSYARRFAAKEACAKALATGIWRHGVGWRDMEVVRTADGRPSLHLHAGALTRLKVITPPSMRSVCHLSLTDDAPYALALVVIEAIAP